MKTPLISTAVLLLGLAQTPALAGGLAAPGTATEPAALSDVSVADDPQVSDPDPAVDVAGTDTPEDVPGDAPGDLPEDVTVTDDPGDDPGVDVATPVDLPVETLPGGELPEGALDDGWTALPLDTGPEPVATVTTASAVPGARLGHETGAGGGAAARLTQGKTLWHSPFAVFASDLER